MGRKKKSIKKSAETIQDEIEETELTPEKYESRYKHGGPMRTVKKKKID